MSKTVERATTRAQWEKLRYPVKLSPLSDEEGGGYLASIPLLGEATCVADGETVEEALANLEEYRRSMFPLVAKSRQPLPLPPERADETSSAATARPAGKWLMRATPEIQAALQEDAAREGVSFNTFCLICLERGRSVHAVEEAARETSRQLHQLQSVLCAEVRAQHLTLESALFEQAKSSFQNATFEIQPTKSAAKPALELLPAPELIAA